MNTEPILKTPSQASRLNNRTTKPYTDLAKRKFEYGDGCAHGGDEDASAGDEHGH